MTELSTTGQEEKDLQAKEFVSVQKKRTQTKQTMVEKFWKWNPKTQKVFVEKTGIVFQQVRESP